MDFVAVGLIFMDIAVSAANPKDASFLSSRPGEHVVLARLAKGLIATTRTWITRTGSLGAVLVQPPQVAQCTLKNFQLFGDTSSFGAGSFSLLCEANNLLVLETVDITRGKDRPEFLDQAAFDCQHAHVVNESPPGNLQRLQISLADRTSNTVIRDNHQLTT